jgi:hypothetical protein
VQIRGDSRRSTDRGESRAEEEERDGESKVDSVGEKVSKYTLFL